MMRKVLETNPKLSQDDAADLLKRCLKVLFYRDCRALNNVSILPISQRNYNSKLRIWTKLFCCIVWENILQNINASVCQFKSNIFFK